MSLFLILLAAGDGRRLKTRAPKPYHCINNKSLLEHSLNSFKNFNEIKKTVIVYNKKHKKHLNKIKLKNVIKVIGGKTRQESSYKALKIIRKMNCKKVIIHDAARPIPPINMIKNLLNKLKKNDAVIPVVKIYDATKRTKNNFIFKNIKRDTLGLAQTPQGFTYKKIFNMHKEYKNYFFDDDSSLFTDAGKKVTVINGCKKNLKITDKEDLDMLKSLIKRKIYSGLGFDIHRLVKGKKLYLGAIKIPFPLGLKGHSDADVVIHSIIDAVLGACKLGDIGKLFSDKNKKFKGIRSSILLKKTIELIESKNFVINNIDINIIAQKPKIKRYAKKMISKISKLCKTPFDQINIKGKTTEKLGLIGKEKAIAAEAIATVIKYD